MADMARHGQTWPELTRQARVDHELGTVLTSLSQRRRRVNTVPVRDESMTSRGQVQASARDLGQYRSRTGIRGVPGAVYTRLHLVYTVYETGPIEGLPLVNILD